VAKKEPYDYGKVIAQSAAAVRAERIRRARERVPTPSYQQIALEAGCSVSTVYNVLKGLTHNKVDDGQAGDA
jgi:DNA invertase Pin-like site-specific DNA recombinase